MYVRFVEVPDRTAAEALQGTELVVDTDTEAETDAEDAWYPHELTGLRAEHVDGRLLGTITGLEHLPAHDVLVLEEAGTRHRTLVPFVHAIVPVVDVVGGRVVLDPPGGLLASDAENLVVSEETVSHDADAEGAEGAGAARGADEADRADED